MVLPLIGMPFNHLAQQWKSDDLSALTLTRLTPGVTTGYAGRRSQGYLCRDMCVLLLNGIACTDDKAKVVIVERSVNESKRIRETGVSPAANWFQYQWNHLNPFRSQVSEPMI